MGGENENISCDSGSVLVVASETDVQRFKDRIAQIRAARTLPPDAKWTESNASCDIFTTDNVWVLYSGPSASPYDLCTDRWLSPPDAFIKGTNPDTSSEFRSCLCPPTPLPIITTVGQQDVHVGELQRALRSNPRYNGRYQDLVGNIDANVAAGNPGQWGTYTAGTQAAVLQFQTDKGLPRTGQVDSATWPALQGDSC